MDYPMKYGFPVVPEETEIACYKCQEIFQSGKITNTNVVYCPKCRQQHTRANKKIILVFGDEEIEFKPTAHRQ